MVFRQPPEFCRKPAALPRRSHGPDFQGRRCRPPDPHLPGTLCGNSQACRRRSAGGVVPGDRVVGFMPNMPESIIAMLAATSIGATWSSCSPDFGIKGVLDRFGQTRPKILFTADGYYLQGQSLSTAWTKLPASPRKSRRSKKSSSSPIPKKTGSGRPAQGRPLS